MGQGWQETALWRELERRGDQASAISDAIKPLLRDLEPVLASGATGDLNFTLHDDEHAFRVAERIAELLGEEQLQAISSFDVGFSLAAAYGHDVGMTPARGKVQQHFAALLSASGMGELPDADAAEFQEWLDDERDGLVPPLTDEQPTTADLRDARLIVAHYARHRHNDWSEEWLRAWAAKNNAGASLYPGWIADLVQICRSHHEGYERLSSRAFAPRRVGNPAQVLHLRHCAVLLRVADVLEIDPERTPDVVFERRAIDDTSEIFWTKDHAISIVSDGTGYTVTARPQNSAIHHAVVQTVAGIDAELQLCRRLADEQPFSVLANSAEPLHNRWELDPRTKSEIEPLDDSYVYVDGTFRPDVRRVLQLLGGVELYGTEWAAVRELLQNAFDAVKEQIARERLASDDPLDEDDVKSLRRRNKVTLELLPAEDGDGLILRCTDTGVGMSKERIVQRFLVSGSGKRHDDRELERACARAGFALEKTARFGIGVLSYFLLGDTLVVETRRSPATADADHTAWRFETNGPGTFGQLTRTTRDRPGTTVQIVLRSGVGGETPEETAASLRRYLADTVQRVPCTFAFEDAINNESFRWQPGWPPMEARVPTAFAHALDAHDGVISTSEHRAAMGRLARQLDQEAVRYIDEQRWLVEREPLPGNLGAYEIVVPWFDTAQGPCLVGFASLEEYAAPEPVAGDQRLTFSWNGMSVGLADHGFPGYPYASVRIDFTASEAGAPSVSRADFTLDKQGTEALAYVDRRLSRLVHEFALRNMGSPTALLNCALTGVRPTADAPRWWTGSDQKGWHPIASPAITSHAPLNGRWLWLGQPVTKLRSIDLPTSSSYRTPFSVPLAPDMVSAAVPSDDLVLSICSLFTGPAEQLHPKEPSVAPFSAFPDAWSDIAAVKLWGSQDMRAQVVINRDHAAARIIASGLEGQPDPAMALGRIAEDPEPLLEDVSLAYAALVWSAVVAAPEFWTDLRDSHSELFAAIHQQMSCVVTGRRIAVAGEGMGRPVVYRLDADGISEGVLPMPSAEQRLILEG